MSDARPPGADRRTAATLALAGLVMASLAGGASGQSLLEPWEPTLSGPARGKSCTQLDRDCIRTFGPRTNAQSARCARIWQFCIRTGVYHDGERTVTGVIRE